MRKFITSVFFFISVLTAYSQSAREFLKKGDHHYKAKDYDNALNTYKAGLKIYPDDAKLNLQAGLTYLSMPNKRQSLTYLQTAFTLNPNVDEDIYYYLGLSYQSNRQYKVPRSFLRNTNGETRKALRTLMLKSSKANLRIR